MSVLASTTNGPARAQQGFSERLAVFSNNSRDESPATVGDTATHPARVMNHPRQSLRATVDGQLFDVGLDESGQVSVADASTGETETIQVSDTGRRAVMTVGLSGPRVLRAHVALDDEAVWVFIDGATFQVEVASAQQDHVRRRDRSCHDALSAPMFQWEKARSAGSRRRTMSLIPGW